MPKTKTQAKKTTKVGSGDVARRLSRQRKILLAVFTLLLLSIAGYVGLSRWEASDLEARAAGWTKLSPTASGVSIKACTTPISSGYGPLWKTTVYFTRTGSSAGTSADFASASTYRNGPRVAHTETRSWNRTVTSLVIYGSRIYPDTLQASTLRLNADGSSKGSNNPATTPVRMSSLQRC